MAKQQQINSGKFFILINIYHFLALKKKDISVIEYDELQKEIISVKIKICDIVTENTIVSVSNEIIKLFQIEHSKNKINIFSFFIRNTQIIYKKFKNIYQFDHIFGICIHKSLQYITNQLFELYQKEINLPFISSFLEKIWIQNSREQDNKHFSLISQKEKIEFFKKIVDDMNRLYFQAEKFFIIKFKISIWINLTLLFLEEIVKMI